MTTKSIRCRLFIYKLLQRVKQINYQASFFTSEHKAYTAVWAVTVARIVPRIGSQEPRSPDIAQPVTISRQAPAVSASVEPELLRGLFVICYLFFVRPDDALHAVRRRIAVRIGNAVRLW